ncbi:MAG: hypothetical protein JNK48_18650 [Bryobacterales bacterium]|nr:hypothetical protein [Bryobacterales bacterium]
MKLASILPVLAFAMNCQAAITFNSQTYNLTTTETITAAFTSIGGQGTTNMYSGLVLVDVSGTGNGAWGSGLNDAFYAEPFGSSAWPGFCGSLGVRTLALPGGCGNYAHNRMVYSLDDNHFVSLAGGFYVPAEQSSHRYRFVISVDSILAANSQTGPQKLYFGTTDGNYGDNGGSFRITVTQLDQAASTPEPGAFWTLGAGLGAVALFRRPKQ